jgi:hypothetical protein
MLFNINNLVKYIMHSSPQYVPSSLSFLKGKLDLKENHFAYVARVCMSACVTLV